MIKFTKIVASRYTLTKNAEVVNPVIFKGEIESHFREERGYNYCQFNVLVITSLILRNEIRDNYHNWFKFSNAYQFSNCI